jgi:hypothetical protein
LTLEEAIVGLEDLSVDDPHFEPGRRKEAILLGIEALKRIKARRDLQTGWELTPLPGETNE